MVIRSIVVVVIKNIYDAFILKIASCLYSCRRLSTCFPNGLFRSFCPAVACYAVRPTDDHFISLHLILSLDKNLTRVTLVVE